MQRRLKIKLFVLTALVLSSNTIAQQNGSLFNFKFSHQTNNNAKSVAVPTNTQPFNQTALKFSQTDASLVYPWQSEIVNIDFGLTLRHLSSVDNSGLNNTSFQKSLPLLHASAFFNTALKGLSAGIVGSHLDSKKNQILDYRAQISYEWRKGFGMQGGWQHQRFNLDKLSDAKAEFESNGPYIDFYLNF